MTRKPPPDVPEVRQEDSSTEDDASDSDTEVGQANPQTAAITIWKTQKVCVLGNVRLYRSRFTLEW